MMRECVDTYPMLERRIKIAAKVNTKKRNKDRNKSTHLSSCYSYKVVPSSFMPQMIASSTGSIPASFTLLLSVAPDS